MIVCQGSVCVVTGPQIYNSRDSHGIRGSPSFSRIRILYVVSSIWFNFHVLMKQNRLPRHTRYVLPHRPIYRRPKDYDTAARALNIMADAQDSNSGGHHSSGEYSGVVQVAHIAKSGQVRVTEEITIAKSPGQAGDIAMVISSGENIKRDRAERKAKMEEAMKKAKEGNKNK